MGTFIIHGGKELRGEITPQGAKNEALQVICATLLTPEKITIKNIPDISDVNKLIGLIGSMGVKVIRESRSVATFEATDIDLRLPANKRIQDTKLKPKRIDYDCRSASGKVW